MVEGKEESYGEIRNEKGNEYVEQFLENEKKSKYKKWYVIIIGIVIIILVLGIFKPDVLKYVKYSCLTTEIELKYEGFYSIDIFDSKEKCANYFKEYIMELYTNGEYEEIVNQLCTNFKYFGAARFNKIEDSEINEVFCESLYKYACENKDNIEVLNSCALKISSLPDFGYSDMMMVLKIDYYKDLMKTKPLESADFFNGRYKATNSIEMYKYLLESLHYLLLNYYTDKENILVPDWTLSIDDYGFDTCLSFYNELKQYYSELATKPCYDAIRLVGYWSGSGYFFEMKEDGYIRYNLPWFEYGDYYTMYNGIIKKVEEDDDSTKDLFKITIYSNSISVYCYKNGKSYTLYKE